MSEASNNPPAVVRVDDDDGDTDSTYGSDGSSSTASLNSSILRYRRENGRSYHAYKDGAYLYPNDDKEADRLDLQHHLWTLTLDGKLGLAPPNASQSSGGRVLDVGTGTGLWALEFGDMHPEAHVIGTDLSPIQPSFVTPNVYFEIDDIEAEWNFQSKFDYIHSRMMNSSIRDWNSYLKNCFENLAPGGWLELQEFNMPVSDDGTLNEKTSLYKVIDVMNKGAEAAGRKFIDVWGLKKMMQDAGFVNVTEHRFFWPTNPWPQDEKLKQLSIWNNANFKTGMEAFLLAYGTRLLGWSKEEVQVLAAKGLADVNNRAIHAYGKICVVYGQKPE